MRAYKTVTSKCSKTTFKIDGLMEGMLYYFRVLPENIYGIGEPRETPDVVLICEVPLPPHKLEVADVTKSSVTLGWEKPEHDGGSRLTGYVIEACKFGTDKWMKVATLKTSDFEHTIEKLNEREQYLFRIRAVNSRGASEPRELVTAVTVQEQRGNILTSFDPNSRSSSTKTFFSPQSCQRWTFPLYLRRLSTSLLARPSSWTCPLWVGPRQSAPGTSEKTN